LVALLFVAAAAHEAATFPLTAQSMPIRSKIDRQRRTAAALALDRAVLHDQHTLRL